MKTSLIAAALLASTSWANAATILTATDDTAPTTACDALVGISPPRVRPCYVPEPGPTTDTFGPYGPSDNNPQFSVTVAVSDPTLVEAVYTQPTFLNTVGGPTPAYMIAIGVDSTTTPCGLEGSVTIDHPGNDSVTLVARCIVTIPAGTTTFYALEKSRLGVSAFKGPGRHLLEVRLP